MDFYKYQVQMRNHAEVHFRELQKPLFTRLLRYIERQEKSRAGFFMVNIAARGMFPAYEETYLALEKVNQAGEPSQAICSLYKYLQLKGVENATELRRLQQSGL